MTFSILPAIDIIDGGLVRLFKGNYQQVTRYEKSPYDMAIYYQSLGLNHIHVVDLNGAKDGRLTNLNVIRSIASIPNMTVQVGGGVRSQQHVDALLDTGVSAVIVGSLIAQDFESAALIMNTNPNRVIAGIDLIDGKLATHGWLEKSDIKIDDLMTQLSDFPLHSIISTDISRDGTFSGPNIDLYRSLATLTDHSIIASGGVSSISDIAELKDLNITNLNGCIVGKAIIEGKICKDDVNSFL